MLVARRGRLVRVRNTLFPGIWGSIHIIFAYLGNFFQADSQAGLVFCLHEVFNMAMLFRSGDCSELGSMWDAELVPLTASLAWQSACSFPSISECPGTHSTWIRSCRCACFMSISCAWISSSRYWPDCHVL